MLDYIRQRSQNAIIIFFVAIICAVFIVNFGPQSQGCGSEGTIWLARVHGETIGINDYQWVERLLRYRFRLPRDFVEGGQFPRDVLEGLIERELLVRAAHGAGLAVGEEEMRDAVVDQGQIHFSWATDSMFPLRGPVRGPFLDEDGRFQQEDFREYVLYGLQLSERAFAEQQLKDILAERMRQLVELSVQLSDDELWAEYSRYADRANIKYARVYPTFFAETLSPSPAEVERWAQQNGKAVEQRYEADRFRYRNVRKQLRVRDIMVRLNEDSPVEEQEQQQRKAEAIAAAAKAGRADFAVLARCFSDDSQTASRGGDLGYLRQGMSRHGREFDEAVFALAPGAISDVIEAKRGLHIVQVLDQREGDVTLEQARSEIAEKLYRKARGEERAKQVADGVLKRARGGATFDETLLEGIPELAQPNCPYLPGVSSEGRVSRRPLEPVVRETGFFNRGGSSIPSVGESSELMTAAFELSEEEPLGSQVFPVRDDLFVIRLADEGRHEPTREEFEEQRGTHHDRLIQRKRQEALRVFVQRLRRAAEEDDAIRRNPAGSRFISGQNEAPPADEGSTDEGTGDEDSAEAPASGGGTEGG